MIPADRFLLDGDTAWWVVPAAADVPFYEDAYGFTGVRGLDRPCETCDGTGRYHALFADIEGACPDCFDGRHTFEIEVQVVEPPIAPGRRTLREVWHTYRVSVVPGMVLPVKHVTEPRTLPNIVMTADGMAVLHHADQRYDGTEWVTLPSAAAPGMWAVLLKVAS